MRSYGVYTEPKAASMISPSVPTRPVRKRGGFTRPHPHSRAWNPDPAGSGTPKLFIPRLKADIVVEAVRTL